MAKLPIYGLMAEFDSPEALLEAARRALDGTAPDDAEIAADVGAAEAELPRLARAARDAG